MPRFSSYSIISDPLPGGGFILLNGISGAMDLVSNELGHRICDLLAGERKPEADDASSILDERTRLSFEERGHVTELSAEEERQMVVELADVMHESAARMPRFMIVPNLDCNYRCSYCFERPLQNALKSPNAEISHEKSNVVLQSGQVEGIYKAIESIQLAAGRDPGGQIILYGGEPLDRRNHAVVEDIVKSGVARNYYFAAITNGHDLDAFIDLIGIGKIEQVQVSIDGPKDVHDKRRIYVGRESSFDAIARNIDLVLEHCTAQVQIRVHVDPTNISLFEGLIDFFKHKGWLDRNDVIVYANTVYEKTREGKVTVEMEHSAIADRLNAIARRHSNIHTSAPAVHASNAMRPAFEQGKRFSLKGTYCSANTGNYIFAPDSKVYACWESVGKACSRVGSYESDGRLQMDDKAVSKWFKRSIATVPGCQTCSYALVCGGGCAQYAEYNFGEPYRPYCDDFQTTFRKALAENAEYYLKQVTGIEESNEGVR